jgi:hypothetical protein
MNATRRLSRIVPFVTLGTLFISSLTTTAAAQPAGVPAGQTVMTLMYRLLVNPPAQTLVYGYFPTIAGVPGLLFSSPPDPWTDPVKTAHFTFSLDVSTGIPLVNGPLSDPGGTSVVVQPTGQTLNIYFNPNPNMDWNTPASFSAGKLIASFKSIDGASSIQSAVVSYLLTSSEDFAFNGKTYNFGQLAPNGFTVCATGSASGLPVNGVAPGTAPFTVTGYGSAVTLGGLLSGLRP